MNIEKKWTDIAKKQLLGRKIVTVRYLTEKEASEMGWDMRGIVLELDDGNLIFPSQDDEGNGAGALFTNDKVNGTIPVIN